MKTSIRAMDAPDGMLALFMFSLPLMALGALALFARWTAAARHGKAAARAMAAATCAVTLAAPGDVRQRRNAEHERNDRAV